MKKDAHLYNFCSWKTYPKFRRIIQKTFEIKNMIIWDKLNGGAGDLEYSLGNRYEIIIFATKGKRKLIKRKDDVFPISKIHSSKLIHATQKPVQLIKELLEISAIKKDLICDPFMGVGTTIKASKEMNMELSTIGIEIDKNISATAKDYTE